MAASRSLRDRAPPAPTRHGYGGSVETMWFIGVNWNQAAVLRGGECSHVADSSDAHRDYSSPLTHRPRNGTDVDRGTEREGEREGGGIPQ